MSNHIHLLISPRRENSLPKLMQRVGTRYVGFINHCHGRTGGLWEGRYHATPVETERYLLTCYRYVELNPVRAGMVPNPAEYIWSSYRCNALGAIDNLVSPHSVYEELGRNLEQRQNAYRALFDDVVDQESLEQIRAATQGGWVLGGPTFAEEIARQTGRPAKPTARGGDRKSDRFNGV